MKEIDWSKAPEWSGAVVESECGDLFWVEEFGVKSRRQSFDSSEPDEHYFADMTLPDHGWRLVEAIQKAWTGTGLPPVGTVCEAYDFECGKWVIGKMLMHGNSDHAFASGTPECWEKLFWACEFRPIRTPEQIAAEERDKAIDDIAEIIGSLWSSEREAAEFIYKAGYRKTEAQQ